MVIYKSFDEWWKGSGQVRGEAIFRNCWDAAIEAARDRLGDASLGLVEDPSLTAWSELGRLKTE